MPLIHRYANRLVMIGCGSIGQGLVPLLFRTFSIDAAQLTIIAADDRGRHVADRFGVRYQVTPVTPENHQAILGQHLHASDLVLNLSVNVSSLALIAWCREHDVLYLDTCVEPWGGGYVSHDPASLETTNAWLRQQALALHSPGAATAVIAHGMNPGLVSHLLKEALLALARSKGAAVEAVPAWGELARSLKVRAVHISERDTQDDGRALLSGEFVNTWSAEGLHSEAWLQHAELGWGAHERDFPAGAQPLMQGRALRLANHGADVRLRSWLPSRGEQQGMLVTHHEVISITELLTTAQYRPTVCYVYDPCPKARDSLANLRMGIPVSEFRVMPNEEMRGFDEIGVLLMHDTGALWHGSTLTTQEAHRLAPCNGATSLQVVAGVIGAMAWLLDHPRAGVVEAEDMDSRQVLAVARPYLGRVTSVETDWRPGSHFTFDEFLVVNNERLTRDTGYIRASGKTKEVRT